MPKRPWASLKRHNDIESEKLSRKHRAKERRENVLDQKMIQKILGSETGPQAMQGYANSAKVARDKLNYRPDPPAGNSVTHSTRDYLDHLRILKIEEAEDRKKLVETVAALYEVELTLINVDWYKMDDETLRLLLFDITSTYQPKQ